MSKTQYLHPSWWEISSWFKHTISEEQVDSVGVSVSVVSVHRQCQPFPVLERLDYRNFAFSHPFRVFPVHMQKTVKVKSSGSLRNYTFSHPYWWRNLSKIFGHWRNFDVEYGWWKEYPGTRMGFWLAIFISTNTADPNCLTAWSFGW